jgi:hypothetical protein
MRRIPFQGLMAWILSLGVGIAVWFGVSAYAARTEAWDAMTPYVVASSIAAFLLGVLVLGILGARRFSWSRGRPLRLS